MYAHYEPTAEVGARACAVRRAQRCRTDLGAWWWSRESASERSRLCRDCNWVSRWLRSLDATRPLGGRATSAGRKKLHYFPDARLSVSQRRVRARHQQRVLVWSAMFTLLARRSVASAATVRPLVRAYSVAAPPELDEGERNIFSKLAERFEPTALNVQDVSGARVARIYAYHCL